ncbi:MAG: enoyl-CoA hydratase [Elusimicrobia bacterium RIFCSPLOWO2_12_FULL_59_9]|nr:MAG: enoyl-CoA hydratase [Elusimicrobia bacterium RIFCSPLOWO2_12_FULL_59_9]
MSETDLVVQKKGKVSVLTLNRPQVRNALSDALMADLAAKLENLDRDSEVRVIVITGAGQCFAAGADISELAGATLQELLSSDRLAKWERVRKIKKPVIAAVSGYALGGGCELALSCDLIVAAEDAVFGQPEVLIGVMPGAGGTQRLVRAIGKYRAMELILTGKRFSAVEAQAWGMVSKTAPKEKLMEEAMALAEDIAKQAPLAVQLIKESVNRALETDLETGLLHERRLFYLLFGTEDQKEGMKAFLEKRKPSFQGK